MTNRKPMLIAFSGKMGSGKDTIGSALNTRLGLNAIHESFSRPLHEEVDSILSEMLASKLTLPASSLPLQEEKIESLAQRMHASNAHMLALITVLAQSADLESLTSYSRTDEIRSAMQYWGTQVRRRSDPDYWVRRETGKIQELQAQGNNVYITDCRFPNEITAIRAIGGVVIRLEASEPLRIERIMSRDGIMPTQSQLDDISETASDNCKDFDKIIHVDGKTINDIVNEIIS